MISQTYVSVIVMILASVLPKVGVVVGSDDLTTTVSVLVTVAAGIWALIRRYRTGDITVAGVRK